MQDGATSHTSNLCQNKLKKLLGKRFIPKNAWPQKSPDLNPVNYHFWDSVQKMVYENKRGKPFENVAKLNRRIRTVWGKAINMNHIWKAIGQFRSCAKKVVELGADPIKQHFR